MFIVFSVTALVLRYTVGCYPVTSPRLQTQYKLKSLPKALNVVLFYSLSSKPVSVHAVILQLINYIMLTVSLFMVKTELRQVKIYFKLLSEAVIVLVIALGVEKAVLLLKGCVLSSNDGSYEINLDSLTAVIRSSTETKEYKIALFINNQIAFYDNEGKLCGSGKLDYKNSKIIIETGMKDAAFSFTSEYKRIKP